MENHPFVQSFAVLELTGFYVERKPGVLEVLRVVCTALYEFFDVRSVRLNQRVIIDKTDLITLMT